MQGKQFLQFRISHGVPLKELSRASGIHAKTIASFELGERKLPKESIQVLIQTILQRERKKKYLFGLFKLYQ
jgi:transcriptional regulator with XRE-family HTH domain